MNRACLPAAWNGVRARTELAIHEFGLHNENMESALETQTVEICGTRERVGDWVVIDPTMTRVLASDATPEEAMHKAGIDPHGHSDGPRPIVMQVMDPALTCLY